jgi:SAM-dependent methyltransferase
LPVLAADHPLRRRLRPIRRLVSFRGSIWRRGLPLEVEFWENYISTGGGEFPGEYQERLDPNAEIRDPLILAAVRRSGSDPVRILDVGAGPLTALGKRDPQDFARRIEIVAIDPLAEEYRRMLRRYGVTPPVLTEACRGEDLDVRFARDTFDIAYARNALDHSLDPMKVIENMVAVVRPGGTIVLRHYRREAEEMSYEQLHQWNFDVEEGRLLLWSKRDTYDVTGQLEHKATVLARLHAGSYHADWVEASINPLQ